ncbi:hypothetical protein [Roseospirillum parvum]|uniref:Uncharacterized protein n=1 Tax=Roseospirillum parvum TaxID=83401 RepID=A0A1G8DR76_9PROT|nr:hypothetical protein [Roseospirillum parvum]SDH60148.1 hypothetical protein SAMN05421742_10895 [Roseospirillum parvum]
MPFRLILPCLLACLLAPLAAVAQTGSVGEARERFLLSVPEGWVQVTTERRGDMEMVEFVPQGQEPTAWRDRLTVQVFEGATNVAAAQFQANAKAGFERACEKVTAGNLQVARSNGYPSAFFVLGCHRHRQEGHGETTFFRLIQGYQALYLVQRAWRTAPYDIQGPPIPQAERTSAVHLLQSMSVCLPGEPRHPCP